MQEVDCGRRLIKRIKLQRLQFDTIDREVNHVIFGLYVYKGIVQLLVLKYCRTFKAPHRSIHFMLIVVANVDKSGTAQCCKIPVQPEHLFWKSERNTPLICTKAVRP